MSKFFVVLGNNPAYLGMPDIIMLNIIKINCNKIGTHRNGSADKCGKTQPSTRAQHMCNTIQA